MSIFSTYSTGENRVTASILDVNMNAQPNGDHEVHRDGCTWMPNAANRIYLGVFNNCEDAVRAARKHYNQVNGCATCSPLCHTQ